MEQEIISIINGIGKSFEMVKLLKIIKKKLKDKEYTEYMKCILLMMKSRKIIQISNGEYVLNKEHLNV